MEQQQKKPLAYFAHPVTTYDTTIERYFISQIERRGYEVLNPNNPIHEEGYKKEGMDYFKSVVQSCDALFLLPFSDGKVGAGTAKEWNWALEAKKPVYRIAINIVPTYTKIEEVCTVLTVDETRERIKKYIL